MHSYIMNPHTIFAVLAILCAIAALVVAQPLLIPVAVIFVAVAVLVP